MPIKALALIAGGYALAYYAINVLVWAHGSGDGSKDPVPLKYCIGFPLSTHTGGGKFAPPFHFGGQTDARVLLGNGTPTPGPTIAAGPGTTGSPAAAAPASKIPVVPGHTASATTGQDN